jgi:pSer/pThr/pTyr-binding forkhead associated (FHA) protein/ribosomal protein S27AE
MSKDWYYCPNPDCKEIVTIDAATDGSQKLTCGKCGYADIASRFRRDKASWIGKCPNPSCDKKIKIRMDKAGEKKCEKCGHVCDIRDYEKIPEAKRPGAKQEGLPRPEMPAEHTEYKKSDADSFRRMAALVLVEGSIAPKKIELSQGQNTIGRYAGSSTCRHQIDESNSDLSISRNHAVIDCRESGGGTYEYDLSDLGSKRGTYLNGKKLEKGDKMVLHDKDKIRLGEHAVFQVIVED